MKKLLSRTYLKLTGWTVVGERPEFEKFVLIAAPHTSNWDLPLMLAFAAHFDLKLSWLGKHTLFEGPMGWMLRALGGLAVDRRAPQGLVRQVAGMFDDVDSLVLAVPPEGTRGYVERWKSGFYHIAREAGVPIVPSVLDWSTKTGGIFPPIMPTGDVRADMDRLRAIYEGKIGRCPEKTGIIRLRDEEGLTPPVVSTERD